MTDYRDLLPVIVEREGAALPDGFDSWGIKSVHPDLRTTHGYRWPVPGHIAECDPGRVITTNTDACPAQMGDGLCVATSWCGMASGGIPARTLLLVAYAAGEVLGRDVTAGKLRCPRVAVVALVDGERLLREAGTGADLRGANLRGADLRGANLRGADLRGANLRGADLTCAYLTCAYLTRANLRGADLRGAHLADADLADADLTRADLADANLRGAKWSARTRWPADFSPEVA